MHFRGYLLNIKVKEFTNVFDVKLLNHGIKSRIKAIIVLLFIQDSGMLVYVFTKKLINLWITHLYTLITNHFNFIFKYICRKRLHYIITCPCFKGFLDLLWLILGRHHHDGCRTKRFSLIFL